MQASTSQVPSLELAYWELKTGRVCKVGTKSLQGSLQGGSGRLQRSWHTQREWELTDLPKLKQTRQDIAAWMVENLEYVIDLAAEAGIGAPCWETTLQWMWCPFSLDPIAEWCAPRRLE